MDKVFILTGELRWLEKHISVSYMNDNIKRVERVLQQAWRCNIDDTMEWRDVPIVLEEEGE